jgi:amino acid transporter
MSPQRILGIVLLIVGVILIVVGMNASHSFADQVSNTFTGKFTDSTAWYIYGGLAAAIGGACLAFVGGGKTT